MNNDRSYLDFSKGSSWATRGAITPRAREGFRTEPYRWRQMASLNLPQLGNVFKPLVSFKPFKWARERRSRS